MTNAASQWVDVIVGQDDSASAWNSIFASLLEVTLQSMKPGVLDKATVVPDRLLANTAWNLWDDFHHYAPTVIDELKKFWVQTTAAGTAVLVLDALSLRELPIILAAAKDRGITRLRVEALGSQVPSDTDRFAQALGLSGRSKLFNNHPPESFIFSGPDLHTDVLDSPF